MNKNTKFEILETTETEQRISKISEIIKTFEKNEKLKEKALTCLFNTFKSNTDQKEVFLKVVALNKMYNAGLTDSEPGEQKLKEFEKSGNQPVNVFEMTNRILELGDNGFEQKNGKEKEQIISLVNSLMQTDEKAANDKKRYKKAYSFATKYVAWTFKDKNSPVPIYDSKAADLLYYCNNNVNENLRFYGKTISWNDLLNYEEYYNIYKKFIEVFGLEDKTYKDVDKFLWQYAKIIEEKESSEKTAQHI